jgi:hypothetical protein
VYSSPFSKKNKKGNVIKKEVDDPRGQVSLAARKNKKQYRVQKKRKRRRTERGEVLRRRLQERPHYNELVVKVCLFGQIKVLCKKKLRKSIRNRVEPSSMTIIKVSSGLMDLAKEMYREVTYMETVELPDEFFDKTFNRHLMLGTAEARRENERVHVLHEKHLFYSFDGTRYTGDADIYMYGAMKYLTNLKNHLTMNLERFMIRAVFALYTGISRKGIWAIINGITDDRRHEDEVEFVEKKASNETTNGASVIRAAIQEHRAVMGLSNPPDKISELKKDKERYYRLILRYFVFLDRELERKAEMKLSEETNEEWERRKAVLMGKRFNVVPMSNIKSHFVTIDSRILHGIMKEISPEFDVSREDFIGENRETYWKSIFDFKRLRVSKQ